jgi:excisionase family DNA binding protein
MAKLMTSGDVQRLFGVTKNTVRRWARDGRLAAIRTPGGAYRFDPVAVETLLEQGSSPKPQEEVAA